MSEAKGRMAYRQRRAIGSGNQIPIICIYNRTFGET